MSLLFKTDLKSGGKRLINLLHVSFFDLKKNQIIFHHAYNKSSIAGNFLIFGGGDNNIDTITFNKEEEAQKSFDEINKTLEQYYSKINI